LFALVVINIFLFTFLHLNINLKEVMGKKTSENIFDLTPKILIVGLGGN